MPRERGEGLERREVEAMESGPLNFVVVRAKDEGSVEGLGSVVDTA